MKIASFFPGKAMSIFSLPYCSLYLKPIHQSAFLSFISGEVLLDLILAIILDLFELSIAKVYMDKRMKLLVQLMSANVVKAMEALARNKPRDLRTYSKQYKIGINSVGAAFEEYVKDLLTGQFYPDQETRNQAFSMAYSWLGNQNFPPDAIAVDGDAFEIKKHENVTSTIALNSSPPRDMLYPMDPMLTSKSKSLVRSPLDIFYIVGTVSNGLPRSIYFVQGKCYAADRKVYESISSRLKKYIRSAMEESGLEISNTKELGRIDRADPLGRASLRVRGMWQIMAPSKAFSEIAPPMLGKEFFAYAIMENRKFEKLRSSASGLQGIKITHPMLPSPNNPATLTDAVVMEVSW